LSDTFLHKKKAKTPQKNKIIMYDQKKEEKKEKPKIDRFKKDSVWFGF